MKSNISLKKLYTSILMVLVLLILFIVQQKYLSINIDNMYKNYFFLTYIAVVLFNFCIFDHLLKKKTPFLYTFSIVILIRYIILPIYFLVNGANYMGMYSKPPSQNSINYSVYLMGYELLASSIYIKYRYNKLNLNKEMIEIDSIGSKDVYFLYALLTLGIIIFIPSLRRGISSFTSTTSRKAISSESNIYLLLIEFIVNTKYFLWFYIIKKIKSNNHRISLMFSYFLILIFSMIVIGFRIGSNRKILIADTIAVMFVLNKIFPEYKRGTNIIIVGIGVIMILFITVQRGMIGSFSLFREMFTLDYLQKYFLGPYNVSMAYEIKNYMHVYSIKDFFLSLMRPIFGIGLLTKNFSFVSLRELFNYRISEGLSVVRTDQIFPMVGQSYLIFGTVLSPTLTLLSLKIGSRLDFIANSSSKLEIIFISLILSFYFAQAMILNFSILINIASFKLSVYLTLMLVSRFFSKIVSKYLSS